MQQGSHSQDTRPQDSGRARKEPPTIDITSDGGYRVHPGATGGRRTGPAPRSATRLGGFLTLAVIGLVLIGAFALGILTFLIAIPVAIGAVVAALVAGFILRHRLRNAAGRPPGPTA
ncbi:MAG: hypothetical protein RIB84_02165 [Sneathiellaceae bacterium]